MGGMRCSIPSTLVPTTSFDKQSRVLFGSQFLDGLVCQLPCIALDKCNQFRPYMFKGLQSIVIVESNPCRQQWGDVLRQAAAELFQHFEWPSGSE